MIRFLRFLIPLGCVLAVSLQAQSLAPANKSTIAAQSLAVGASSVVDLSNHFEIEGVTGPLVRWETVFGDFDVELLPDAAPAHVTNFLAYASAGDFDNTLIHRIADLAVFGIPAIVQGGLYRSVIPLEVVTVRGSVDLEYNLPNTRGTLAAARSEDLNSAGSQWYFNSADNSTILDEANQGGYTVFGRVLSNGMTSVDRMAAITRFNVDGGVLSEMPLRFYSGGNIEVANFVTMNRIYPIVVYPDASNPGALIFTATSSEPGVVAASIVNGNLSLMGISAGTATITIKAADITEASVEQTFTVMSQGSIFTSQPSSQDVSAGANVAMSVAVDGSGATYQWFRHRAGDPAGPQAITGATSATLNLSGVQLTDMGFYFARVTIGGNTVDSAAAILTLAGGDSRLANLSTRGRIPAGGTLTPGFVLRGDGPKPLVVRSVGPKLFDFSVTDALADPQMDLIPQGGSAPLISNDNWGDAANATELVIASAALGAFGLNGGSLDAAVLADVPLPNSQGNRGYTVRISSTSSTDSGIALAEVYDPQDAGVGAKLINVSALGNSGPGVDALIPGFVISGDGAKTMLVRVVGPALGGFGVVGAMDDPRLSVVPLGQNYSIAENDNWGGIDTLKTAFATAGAFEFGDDASNDAAVLVRLPPGGYTVKVEGAGGETGIVLVEAYDLD
jgi:cyclophilin family peptidyl-prolyl cis-trans isomerase